jgi:hypothetical protein
MAVDGVGGWVGVERVVLGCREEHLMSARARPHDARARGARYQHRVGVDNPGPGVVARALGQWRREPLGKKGRIGGGTVALSTVAASGRRRLVSRRQS